MALLPFLAEVALEHSVAARETDSRDQDTAAEAGPAADRAGQAKEAAADSGYLRYLEASANERQSFDQHDGTKSEGIHQDIRRGQAQEQAGARELHGGTSHGLEDG